MFKKYQHLERFGTTSVEGIERGVVHVFPKLDGANGSIWIENGEIKAGSRNRELTLENDNAGFYAWVLKQENIKKLLLQRPYLTLYGEWLVPHSLKTYRENSWRKFYVFDVLYGEDLMHYDVYSKVLDTFEIEYVPPICTINNGSEEQIRKQLLKNTYLIDDGVGEGIVLKNYSYENRYGKNVFAKIVTSEFNELHKKAMGAPDLRGKLTNEVRIVDNYLTEAFIEKEFYKFKNKNGFESKDTRHLMELIFKELISEEIVNIVEKLKNPTIDFKELKRLTFDKIKNTLWK